MSRENKTRVAVIGSGNIGTDLMIKVLRLSETLEMGAMVGIDPSSDGLARATRLGVPTTAEGVDGLITLPGFDEIEIVFDATSAGAHQANAAALAASGKTMVDLTPAAIGTFVVPAVNLDEHLDAANVNMVTCGGQATIPVVAAITSGHRNGRRHDRPSQVRVGAARTQVRTGRSRRQRLDTTADGRRLVRPRSGLAGRRRRPPGHPHRWLWHEHGSRRCRRARLGACRTAPGLGAPGLLTAYQQERRAVALRNRQAAARHSLVRGVIMSADRSAMHSERWFGARARQELGREISDLGNLENEALGIELGYRYDDSPVVARESGRRAPVQRMDEYTPSTWPGSRPPSVLLEGGPDDGRAIFDLLCRGFRFEAGAVFRFRASAARPRSWPTCKAKSGKNPDARQAGWPRRVHVSSSLSAWKACCHHEASSAASSALRTS